MGRNECHSGELEVAPQRVKYEGLRTDDGVIDYSWTARVTFDCRNRVENKSGGGDSGAEVNGPGAEEGKEKKPTALLGTASFSAISPGGDWGAEWRGTFCKPRKVPGRGRPVEQAQSHVGLPESC